MPQAVIVFGPEWQRVENQLRLIDAQMVPRLREAVWKKAEKYTEIAQHNARSLPTPRHAGHTGLRERVAQGVHPVVRGRAGVRIVTSMAENDERIIPRGFDRREGWRHPFFGDRDRWYRNPGFSWFMEIFDESCRQDVGEAITDVLERAANQVADAGGLHT